MLTNLNYALRQLARVESYLACGEITRRGAQDAANRMRDSLERCVEHAELDEREILAELELLELVTVELDAEADLEEAQSRGPGWTV